MHATWFTCTFHQLVNIIVMLRQYADCVHKQSVMYTIFMAAIVLAIRASCYV